MRRGFVRGGCGVGAGIREIYTECLRRWAGLLMIDYRNYAGEITLWTGIAVTAAGVLTSRPGLTESGLGLGLGGKIAAMTIAGISPAFVTFLLTQVSGIPMSETKYDKRFANDQKYQEWKKNTPVLFPKLW